MIFRSERKVSVTSVLKQYLPVIVLLVLLLIYNLIFPQYAFVFKRNYFWIALVIPLSFIMALYREQLSTITFDDEKRLIIFSYKSVAEKARTFSLSYDNAKVEIDDSTSVSRWFRRSITVYFLKNDLEIAKVSSRKDGFSVDTINQLCYKVNQLASEGK